MKFFCAGCESRARGVFDVSAVPDFEEENIPQQCLQQGQTWKWCGQI